MFREIDHRVVYTDAAFKQFGGELGYLLAQVPYHPSGRFFLSFLAGKIPEWRGRYSSSWFKKHFSENYSHVYAFVYSTECMKYAHWISKKKKLPLTIHLADHSESFKETGSIEILSNASKLICITDEMKSKYEGMLGRSDIEVLHNGAEQTCIEIPSPPQGPFNKENPFIICFIGGLFSHLHGDCIEDIFEAVAQIRKKKPWIEFHLYGQRQPSNFMAQEILSEGCTHHGIVMPLEKKFDIMERAHCFVVPSSFKKENHKHYRYSFPTKLPELIASKRPILSYGPQDTATNRILASNELGIRVSDRSVTKLVKTIQYLESQYPSILNELSKITPEILLNFSAENVRKKLSKIISSN
jgi:glycosyltransferase involved in cell wall biosynthesis